jgi:hypothetical protein
MTNFERRASFLLLPAAIALAGCAGEAGAGDDEAVGEEELAVANGKLDWSSLDEPFAASSCRYKEPPSQSVRPFTGELVVRRGEYRVFTRTRSCSAGFDGRDWKCESWGRTKKTAYRLTLDSNGFTQLSTVTKSKAVSGGDVSLTRDRVLRFEGIGELSTRDRDWRSDELVGILQLPAWGLAFAPAKAGADFGRTVDATKEERVVETTAGDDCMRVSQRFVTDVVKTKDGLEKSEYQLVLYAKWERDDR